MEGQFSHVEQVRPPVDEDEEPHFDYPAPEKKKQPPQMNLLKRSVRIQVTDPNV